MLLNPNRSLDRLFNQSLFFLVCLCHISISLCSMTLLGLGRASKLPLLSKKTLLPFGRDVILKKQHPACIIEKTFVSL